MPPSASWNETQRSRIHAVAEMRGFWAVVKNVTEVSGAFGAGNCSSDHTKVCVADLGYVLGSDRRPETRPSRSRFELRGGIEERVIAADAAIETLAVQVPVLSRECDFGVGVARDVEDSRRELLAPFRGGFDDLGDANLL